MVLCPAFVPMLLNLSAGGMLVVLYFSGQSYCLKTNQVCYDWHELKQSLYIFFYS